jgi:hypothetical protein
MPKDNKKYRYFQIGIGWESWTLDQLEQDAILHQMEDQPAKLIVLRLTEYYKLVERGVIVPGVTAMMQTAPAPAPAPMNGHSSPNGAASSTRKGSGRAAAPAEPKEEEPAQNTGTVAESDAAEENADAALDFFTMDDDE